MIVKEQHKGNLSLFFDAAGSESIFSITGRWCGLVELGIIMDAQVLSSLSNKNLKLLSCMSSFKKKTSCDRASHSVLSQFVSEL